jgi:hypothetical protein
MGLLRGVARTAAIAGTATAVSNRVSRRQAGRWAAQDQQQQYESQMNQRQSGGGSDSTIDQLQQLADLKSQGVLTDAEFEAQKARILNSR